MDLDSDIDDFEAWEPDAELYYKEDWHGLLQLRKDGLQKHPNDLYAQQRYAEALVLNKKYNDAIEFLKPLYQKHYDIKFGVTEIIDALYGLGKTENDFNWIEKPDVLKLDKKTLESCSKLLKGKRKHISLGQLYTDLLIQTDYLKFNEQELSEFLISYQEIFEFIGDKTYFFDLEVKLKRLKK